MGRLLGIVGKPNVGKSTFFSAATLVHVPIANFPFTTVKPNKGMAYVRAKCVCGEFGVKDKPVNSICSDGVRWIPVELIDCAGLVPGAWQGRGLGNQFLDEIRKADALIHVVDASGGTDEEGRPTRPGMRDPLEDVKFLDRELDMWMLKIVEKDWARISKRVEATGEDLALLLADRLSGLGIGKGSVLLALEKTGLEPNRPTAWSGEDLERLVHAIRVGSKPMLIAANKIDIPEAAQNIRRLEGLGHPVVPCSAEAELILRRTSEKGLTDYRPGDKDFKVLKEDALLPEQKKALDLIRERVLSPWGSTGVQEALEVAYFKLLKMIVVYPVVDPERLTDHYGRVLPDAYLVPQGSTARDLAYMIHSDLGEGFLYSVDARTGKRLGEDYVLKDKDVISVVSVKRRP